MVRSRRPGFTRAVSRVLRAIPHAVASVPRALRTVLCAALATVVTCASGLSRASERGVGRLAALREDARTRRWLGELRGMCVPLVLLGLLVLSMNGEWHVASAQPTSVAAAIEPEGSGSAASPERKKLGRELAGKLNLNTATEDQLVRLPTVGPAKAERIIAWRKKNGLFKRPADLRRVKGFGYKTFKRLEPFLDVQGPTTLQ